MTDKCVPDNRKNCDELEIELASINSTALARLIEEVQNDSSSDPIAPNAYNRTYHRHNR